MSRTARKARFAFVQRRARITTRLTRKHGHEPGFLGVAHNFRVNGKLVGDGSGVLYYGAQEPHRWNPTPYPAPCGAGHKDECCGKCGFDWETAK